MADQLFVDLADGGKRCRNDLIGNILAYRKGKLLCRKGLDSRSRCLSLFLAKRQVNFVTIGPRLFDFDLVERTQLA